MNIVLTGFMGAGKSSIAAVLSPLMKKTWIEMDHLVLQKTNTQTMQELFALGGELLLRETEIAIVKEYACKTDLVISTGGGVVLNKIIFDYFKAQNSLVVFLDTTFATIAKRLEGDQQRPLFQDLSLSRQMYEFRVPLYRHYADIVIDTEDKTPLEIAEEIYGL